MQLNIVRFISLHFLTHRYVNAVDFSKNSLDRVYHCTVLYQYSLPQCIPLNACTVPCSTVISTTTAASYDEWRVKEQVRVL
jgi:hypothetical protein